MPYKATFGTETCLDPTEVYSNLAQLGEPVPDEFWRANSYSNPLGETPGEGYVLLSRKQIDKLDKSPGLNTLFDVVLDAGMGPASKRKCDDVVFIKATRLLHGKTDDTRAPYLVHFADRRWELKNPYYTQACDEFYNVPIPGSPPDYDSGSLNGGAAWTWTGIVQDLWSECSTLGTYPGLPYTPNGTPQNLVYIGWSAWDALNDVLARISCAIKYEPDGATYSIVKIAADDDDFDKAVAKWKTKRLIRDDNIVESKRGKVPYGVRVFFRKWLATSTEPEFTTVDIVGAYSADTAAGIYHPLWDDMLAEVDTAGAITNQSALNTRAQERADQYYEQLVDAGTRGHRVYSGLITDFEPGSLCKGVAWRMQWGASDDNVLGDSVWAWVTEVWEAPQVKPFSTRELCCDGEDKEACLRVVTDVCCNPTTGKFAVKYKYLHGDFTADDTPCATGLMSGPLGSPLGSANDGNASCEESTCSGQCTFKWDPAASTGGAWLIISSTCGVGCTCPPPPPPPPKGTRPANVTMACVPSASPGPGPAPAPGPGPAPSPGGGGSTGGGSAGSAWRGSSKPSLDPDVGPLGGPPLGGGKVSFFSYGGVNTLTPAALTAAVNDYAPGLATGVNFLRLDTDGGGPYNLTGLAGGEDGMIVYVFNLHATDTILVKHDSASSAAANRILLPSALDVSLVTAGGVPTVYAFIYDGTTARWRNFAP